MTLDTLIMLMGALVLVTPHLGFPVGWFNVIYFVYGAVIIGLGIIARRGGARVFRPIARKGEFVENAPVAETIEHHEA